MPLLCIKKVSCDVAHVFGSNFSIVSYWKKSNFITVIMVDNKYCQLHP